jgi:hypothetical protein
VVRDIAQQSDSAGAIPAVAHVYSRFGLYIPSDGEQTLEIKDSAPGTVADLAAYAIPPKYLDGKEPNDIGPEYTVPITDVASGEPTVVHVPYRRTLKKLEASWTGDPSEAGLTGGIEGTGKLGNGPYNLEGKLTNGTGRKLRDVYFAYKWHTQSAGYDSQNLLDYLVYIPDWGPGVTLDLAKDLRFDVDKAGKAEHIPFVVADGANPEVGHKCRGAIQAQWEAYWMKGLASGGIAEEGSMDLEQSLIVLSLFDRLMPNQKQPDESHYRVEFLRRGARQLDCSAALAAGSMVVVAREDASDPAAGTLPIPLDVNGDRVGGNGERLYQFIVPMDNTFETTPTTAPSE